MEEWEHKWSINHAARPSDGVKHLEALADLPMRWFWELELFGIMKDDRAICLWQVYSADFIDGQRFQMSLLWKENTPPLCHRRLGSLTKAETPASGRVRLCHQRPTEPGESLMIYYREQDQVHYLPHHGIAWQDKMTSKIRIVYNASAKMNGPSLNYCLYTGPCFSQSIFVIELLLKET